MTTNLFSKTIYLVVSLIPVVLLVGMVKYESYLKEKLSYGVILLGFVMFLSSVLLTTIDVVLAINAIRRKKSVAFWLFVALLASLPAIVYIAQLFMHL